MEAELTTLMEQIEILFGIIQLLAVLFVPIVVLTLIMALITDRKYRGPKEGKDMDG